MSKVYFERISRKKALSVKKQELNSAFRNIKTDWEANLKAHGIKLPKKGTAKWYQLAVLKHFQMEAVHKDDVANLINKLTGKAATDQQIRHLKTQGGWHILNKGDSFKFGRKERFTPQGCHVLITTKKPIPNSTPGRRKVVRKGDWKSILKEYKYACASCGTKIGERHRFDSSLKVESLEKGHMNPNKSLEPGNIIPQCHWCNKTALGDFTFDEQGRPRTIASVRPVSRADEEVINKVEEWMLNRKGQKSK
ncbi:hypothetical protein [Candidatus Mycalebacterium sp.]